MANLCSSLRLWIQCKAMEWNHLPVHGGIYDQSPILLDDWEIINEVNAQVSRQKAKHAKSQPKGKGRRQM